MTERRRFGRQDLFGLVQLTAVELIEPGDFLNRRLGEEAQKAADIGILGIAPELPVFISRQLIAVEPDGTADTLSIFAAEAVAIRGVVRPKKSVAIASSPQLDAANDVAPLVGTTDLQLAAKASRQFDKVVGLQDR